MTQLDGAQRTHRTPGPRGITLVMVEAALRRHAGVFSLAAQDLGVSRQAVFDRVRRSERLQRVVTDIEETLLDAVDAGIADLIINKRDPTTLRWYADRKGHRRGYGNRDDFEDPPAPPVTIHVRYVDPLPQPTEPTPASLGPQAGLPAPRKSERW